MAQTFKYRAKGNSGTWNEGEISAADADAAEHKLDLMYGVERDKDGYQTNKDLIEVEMIES